MAILPTKKYPSTIPNVSTISATVDAQVLRTQMDSGRFRQRKRFSLPLENFNVTFTFDDTQFYIFEAFVYGLNDGADWFTMTLPLGSGFQDYPVRIVNGKYNPQYVDFMHWRVSCQLEVDMLATADDRENYFDFLIAIDFDMDALEAANDRYFTLINSQMLQQFTVPVLTIPNIN